MRIKDGVQSCEARQRREIDRSFVGRNGAAGVLDVRRGKRRRGDVVEVHRIEGATRSSREDETKLNDFFYLGISPKYRDTKETVGQEVGSSKT